MTVPVGSAERGPVQVSGEVFSIKRVGDYFHLTLVADGIPERTRPGSFVALAVGGPGAGTLLRRAFSVYRVRPAGVYGGTVEIIFAAHGAGTRWMAQLAPHDPVDAVGPLGRPFKLPKEPVACALVGGGYGSAPLFMLAERLRQRRCAVHMVLGASTEARLFGTLEARRAAQSVTVTTLDGSVGIRGLALAQPAFPLPTGRSRLTAVSLSTLAFGAGGGASWSPAPPPLASRRCTSSPLWILAWSVTMAWIRVSGPGGHPGA